ncbi:hypothetical protein [Arthrobacter bambusae]|uniref:hypothetical protein n=1 Tax=Arthrobacter bambusae TaxID=1338426 RepID=UPI00278B20A2|nr:hypothetical protein [Arthrobacter bambusae]MDQ0031203.1 hypothetical protein [Arthrobacter bambusae]MDQ0099507.1 hypothetical protein [Arthrobacter bambusae]
MAVQAPWRVSASRLHRSDVGTQLPLVVTDAKHSRPPQHRADRGDPRVPGALAATAVTALILGVWALKTVNAQDIGGAGLIQVLPASYFFALGLNLAGFVGSLGLKVLRPWLLVVQLLVLIVILHGADPIIHGLPRLEASYRHLGITDYITQTGGLDRKLDAYFNWPGFFGLLAMLSNATGIHDLTWLATWAPVGVNVLLMPALLALTLRLSSNPRQAWAGVWMFYLASWVGQDYLSPQACALLLLLTLIACVLTVFPGWPWKPSGKLATRLRNLAHRLEPGKSAPMPIELPRLALVILAAVCVVLLAGMTVAHQLTPFAAIPILVMLALGGKSRLRFLPVLALLFPVCWLVLAATPFLIGHLHTLFGSIGNINAAASASLLNRVGGNPAHQFVVYSRLAEGAVIWILAGLGSLRGRRLRTPWLAAALGTIAPFVMFPLQSYGGELLLRIYLFSLPFAASLVVLPLLPLLPRGPSPPGLRQLAALLLLGSIIATGTVATRYGNDAIENFTPDEIAVANQLYATAPHGSVLIEAVHDTAWRYEHYAGYRYETVLQAEPARPGEPEPGCASITQLVPSAGAYLIVTASQITAADVINTGPSEGLQHFIDRCALQGGWSVEYRNNGGAIYHLQGAPNGI